MANFVLIYTGGMGMEMTEEEGQQVMADWGAWYGKLGDAVVDGGNPFAASKKVTASGIADGATTSPVVSGYTVISADSLDDAVAQCKDHPHIKYGGEVCVYETIDMSGE